MKKLLLFLFIISFHSYAQDTIPATKSVIALDKMNVVYRGVENPISIAVNNAKSYVIYGDGVSKNEEGRYVIRPGSGNETKVFVEIENFDGSKVVEEHIFRVLSLPKLSYTINKQFSDSTFLLSKNEIKNAEIGIGSEGFIFDGFTSNVLSFNIKVPGFPTQTVIGNKITDEVYNIVLKAKKKDIIVISDIKGTMTVFPNIARTIKTLTFKIID